MVDVARLPPPSSRPLEPSGWSANPLLGPDDMEACRVFTSLADLILRTEETASALELELLAMEV